jgi:acyl carrier protein
MTDVDSIVLDIIADKAKVDRHTLTRATDLSTLAIDSLDVVEIIFQLEEKFDISIPFNANEASAATGVNFKKAGDVIDMVVAHIGERGGQLTA